jgi:hypothetical protein
MVVDSSPMNESPNLMEKMIYSIVAFLIWLPLVADQYLLEPKILVGNIEKISATVGSNHKGFEVVKIRLKEPNKFSVEHSVNPNVAKNLKENHIATIYESRLLFRILKVEQDDVELSNSYGGLNMVIIVVIFLIPVYLFLKAGRVFLGNL